MKETIKQIEDQSYTLPGTEMELFKWCDEKRMIDSHLRLTPGLKMMEVEPQQRSSVMGKYGLEQLDCKTHFPVARCGFNIIEGKILEITHTPQGNRPEKMNCGERQRVRSRDFRSPMIEAMIAIGRRLSLSEVRSIFSGDHYGTRIGTMDDVEAYRRLDKPFGKLAPEFNFQLKEIIIDDVSVGYWILDLG